MNVFSDYVRRERWPFEGQVAQEIVDNGDGTLTVVFDDYTFVLIRKGADGTS